MQNEDIHRTAENATRKPIRYLSLFSGIEAATVAWHPLGWECVGVAEVEPFPSAVLAQHYPKVPNLGDVTKITEERIKQLGPIDLVVGGFPCQDLSVAGKRKGLINADGTVTRSGLFFTGMQIFKWARQHCGARYLLIENVPGLYSSNKGADFAAVVGHMAGLEDVRVPAKGWGTEGAALGDHGLLEWGTLDAQWFGLAQRRKRVFALLDTGDWSSRPPILLEPESLRGDTAPSREAGQRPAPTLSARTKGGGELGTDFDCEGGLIGCWWDGGQVSQTLDAVLYKGQTMPEKNRFPAVLQRVTHPLRADGFDASEDGTGRGTPLVPVGYLIHGENSTAMTCNGSANVADPVEVARCLDSCGGYSANQGGNVVGQPVAFNWQGGDTQTTLGYDPASGIAGALAVKQTPAVAFDLRGRAGGAMPEGPHDTVNMRAASGGSSRSYIAAPMAVRRITPNEGERLQGFPEGYTAIRWRGKPVSECPDGPRYKALGNSMAVLVMSWLGKQIQKSEKTTGRSL